MKTETRTFYEQTVQRTIERIAVRLDEALDLHTLSRDAGMSPFHFHRMFRGMIGETPTELVRRLRMERAAAQLLDTDDPVTEVAFAAGYETHEAFSRAFRSVFTMAPSTFRTTPRARIEIVATCGVHYTRDGRVQQFTPRLFRGAHMDVQITDLPEMSVGTVHHVGPYNQINHAFERLGSIAGPARLFEKPGALMVGLFYDDPESTAPDQLQSDAGIVLPDGAGAPDGLIVKTVPAGKYATTTHVGPYENLGDVWARFVGEWLPSSGQRLKYGPSIEIYRNTPMTVPKDQLITELYIPLE